MNEPEKGILMGFTKEFFPQGAHVCLIYDNEEQRKKIVSEYMAAGLRQGEQVRYFTDTTTPDEIRLWLTEMGIEIPDKDSFGIFNAESGYCPHGEFEPQKMIDGSVHRYELAEKAGYKGVRSCGEMTWALKGIKGSERFIEYEALLNTVIATFPHSGMCQYDTRLFDGATLFKVLQLHPYMIAQGQIVSNPFYIKPEVFLADKNANKPGNG
jgi:hypothetical protein